jgi:thioredoxin 1
MSKIADVTDASFDTDVLKSEIPVVVDFWAPWCGPCRMMAPVLEAASERWAGRVKFAKLDTDQNGSIAMKQGIQAIPTLIVFDKGSEKDRAVGFLPAAKLDEWLQGIAAPAPA